MADSVIDTPVALIGGGPVGLMLALWLDALGTRCVLVNTEPTTRWIPKGSTQNARTLEHYRRLGLSKAIRDLGLPRDYPTDVAYFTRLAGRELARIPMPTEAEKRAALATAGPTDQVPEPVLRCNQMYVERFLLGHVRTLDTVTVRYGWACEDWTDRGDRVEAVLVEAETGRREILRCRYLVGCDGPQSAARRKLGFSMSGDVLDQPYMGGPMVNTHVRAPDFYRLVRAPKAWQYWAVNPEVRSNLVALDGEAEFIFTTRLGAPGEEPDPRTIARQFHETVGAEIDSEFLAHSPWTAGQALVSDGLASGRVFLAGDAVHLFTPTGAFGMNTGVDESVNLAWKLAATLQGWGGPGLLASYEAERLPVAWRNTQASKQLAQNVGAVPVDPAMEDDTPDGEAARARAGAFLADFGEEFASVGIQLGVRYEDSPIVVPDGTAPPPDDPVTYTPSACPGCRAPHFRLADGTSMLDRLGVGFTILKLREGAETARLEAAAKARGVPLAVLEADTAEPRDLYERDLALIRPDQHVAWRGDALPDDCDALLARATGW